MYSDEFSKLPINGNETTGDYGKMEVTDRMKENLSTAAKWMKFLSITLCFADLSSSFSLFSTLKM